MAKGKKKKFATTENPEFAHWMHALGSSNATQPHDSRPNRQRSRSDARKAAIRDFKD